jgi:hypothetical protein
MTQARKPCNRSPTSSKSPEPPFTATSTEPRPPRHKQLQKSESLSGGFPIRVSHGPVSAHSENKCFGVVLPMHLCTT